MTGNAPPNRSTGRILVLAYGNPGRLDDGLGPAIAQSLESLDIPDLVVEANYQLSIEDAADFGLYDTVIFADASINAEEPFSFREIEPKQDDSFTTHSVSPEAILFLAKQHFNAEPKAYIIGIRGYEFNDFGEHISTKAQSNLSKALAFLEIAIRRKDFALSPN